MIRVVSWQQSGVAWAPWRWRRCLRGSELVEMSVTGSAPGLESYGLPEVDEVLPSVLDAARGADVLHLHHAAVSDDLIPGIRHAYPKVRIVVTIHGEPDRTFRRQGCENPPEAYHVVEPGLKALCANAPATFIPNHPATLAPDDPIRKRRSNYSLLVPFSHVKQHKDRDAAHAVAQELARLGWHVEWMGARVDNATMKKRLVEHDACWIQLQGYIDILTMECWSAGVLPVVLAPETANLRQLAAAFGFAPVLPFRDPAPAAIAKRLHELAAWDSIGLNRELMASCWTLDRSRSLWENFYTRLVEARATRSSP